MPAGDRTGFRERETHEGRTAWTDLGPRHGAPGHRARRAPRSCGRLWIAWLRRQAEPYVPRVLAGQRNRHQTPRAVARVVDTKPSWAGRDSSIRGNTPNLKLLRSGGGD